MNSSSNNIVIIIPARGGSKRVPNKNKKLLNGKELVRYAIESSLQSKYATHIVVSTDDGDILEIAASYDKVTAIRRPDNISGDKALAITYVEHTLKTLDSDFDIVVIVQPSSPFTLGDDIDATVQLLIEDDQADSSVTVMELDHAIHPAKLKTLYNGRLKPYWEEEQGRMAAHELPQLFVRNGSVYASKIALIEKGKIIGDHCLGYVMPRERSIDINDPVDFDFAEFMLTRNE